jgi:hypothetical protein
MIDNDGRRVKNNNIHGFALSGEWYYVVVEQPSPARNLLLIELEGQRVRVELLLFCLWF